MDFQKRGSFVSRALWSRRWRCSPEMFRKPGPLKHSENIGKQRTEEQRNLVNRENQQTSSFKDDLHCPLYTNLYTVCHRTSLTLQGPTFRRYGSRTSWTLQLPVLFGWPLASLQKPPAKAPVVGELWTNHNLSCFPWGLWRLPDFSNPLSSSLSSLSAAIWRPGALMIFMEVLSTFDWKRECC